MKNKILNFELDSKDIKLKKLLEGDFLRLEAYTISDAKPNRNGSHFTKEAMEQAIPTFFDKPVLAYYNPTLGEEGDFMGHECPNGLQYDESIDELYYDYDAPQSEIPIGTVRQSDTVELVEKDGLNWIKVTCVLWTKYNYKAVRSLLRSRKGKTKLSVEIEVLSSHEEDGIEVIDEFQLDGFTLLGRDRRGHEIEEGIAGAHAIAIDFLNENFVKHQQCLAFAYSALDNYTSQQKVETPSEVQISEKDSNIDFDKKENPVDNEEVPQVSMEEKVNQEGGIPAMQLTMRAKIELLQVALEKALRPEDGDENHCYYIWVMDICDKYVYYETNDEKFRCPYVITELGEEHSVELDLSAQERVVSSWSVFSAEESTEAQKEEFDHEGGEGEEGHKCIECTIRDLIIDEEEAIQGYSHAEKHFEEEYPLIAKIFHEIKEEEEVHIGELQQCLQMVNDESQEHIEEGIQEAKEIVVDEILEEQEEKAEGVEQPEGGMEKIFEENKEEDPDQKDKEEDPEEDKPENKEVPEDDKDVKKEEEACDTFESDEDKDDDKDEDDEDEDDEDDEKHEPDEDKDDKEDDFDCGKESQFSNTLDPNAEPLNVDVDGQTMSNIVENATASIKAPEVETNVEAVGDANAEVAKVMENVDEVIIEGDPDGTANEDGSPINPETVVKQPQDDQKERDKQFVSNAESSDINVEELLKKYNELEEKFNQLNNAAKAQEAEKLVQFGKDFINADEVVDEETKQNYIAQVEEKCKTFEFTSEEEVTKFAKGLMAMYYYEHQAVRKENSSSEEFSLTLTKPTRVNNSASNNKLKDAINKLNYLNKEE